MSFLFPVGSHTMPSVFKTYTRIVVQELDAGGDMIAVRSIQTSLLLSGEEEEKFLGLPVLQYRPHPGGHTGERGE